MIHGTINIKYSVCFSFIYRYSQLFNVVSSCHTADVTSVSDFVPNPMNHVRVYAHNRSVIRVPSSPKLSGRSETLSWMHPTHKSPGVLNQAIVVAKLCFRHDQSMMTGRNSKQLCGDWNAIWRFEWKLEDEAKLLKRMWPNGYFYFGSYYSRFL